MDIKQEIREQIAAVRRSELTARPGGSSLVFSLELAERAAQEIEKGDALASAVIQYLTAVATAGEALRAAMIRFDRRAVREHT